MKRFLVLGLLALVGCGSGNDPLTIIGDSEVTPAIELPVASTDVILQFSAYSSAADFHTITLNSAGTSRNVVSPVSGVVTAVDAYASTGLLTVGQIATIYHSPNLSVRVAAPSISVRKGDYLQPGSVVGTSTQYINLYVTHRNAVSCGYSFLSATSRARVTALGGANPCL